MSFLKTLAVAAVAVAGMGTAAMAADMVMAPPPPAAVMASGWDGGYIGVDAGVYTPPTGVQGDVFAGVNMTVSESFLIGAEASVGIYNNLPGLGVELTGSVRGGFIVSDAVLLYGKLGGAYDFPGTRIFVGGGAEFKVMDSMTIRAEGTIDTTGQVMGTIGALWHF